MEQNINLDILNNLSEEERAAAIEILKQYAESGESELLNTLKYADFEEIPVDIETFLHDKKYLGNGLYDAEGRFTVYPFWEETLKDIFPTNLDTKYNTIVLTGSIGIGKSFIAVICILYMLYRLLCLRDPYSYYGMQKIDKLSISFMNITLEAAKGVMVDKMNQLILSSEWFMAHGEMTGVTNLVYRPQKHIEFITASSNNQIIGRAIIANASDEVNFALFNDPEKQKKKMMKIITQLDARMRSRFLRGTYLPTLNIICSSKDTEQSFLDAYIKNKRETESKTTLIVDKPQWVVDSRKDTPEKFYVGIGSRLLPNELFPLDVSEEEISAARAKGYDIWQVPMGYLETFQTNLDEAICSIIGISTASSLKYISGERLEAIKTTTYQNPFVKDVIEVGNGPEDLLQYANFFDVSRINPDDVGKPLFIHLDLSLSGDKTGIAGVWITGKQPSIKQLTGKVDPETGLEENIDYSLDLRYKTAFSVSIKAPKGFQVSFEKTRNFIRWLREQGFAIKCISCFKGDTLISTPNGPKKIKDIIIGDTVYAYDDDAHKIVESKVYNTANNGPRDEFIKIWISSTDFIECTPEHLIKTQRGYVMAKDLTEDDMVEIDKKLFYKQKLLKTGFFYDNTFLEDYIDFITNYDSNSIQGYSENHHIIPKCIFNKLKLQIDNSELNMIRLKYKDHVKAHYLLTKCCLQNVQYALSGAVTKMLGKKVLTKSEIFDFLSDDELQAEIEEIKLLHNELTRKRMLGNKLTKGRHHTEEEILKISESNKKPHGVHPSTEFKKGDEPWNKCLDFSLIYTEEERKEKFSKNGDYIWISNGKEELQVLKDSIIPEGFIANTRKKLSEETKQKLSNRHKELGSKPPAQSGFKYYTNGTETIRVFEHDIIPEGFYEGRTFNTETAKKTGFIYSEQFRSLDPKQYREYYLGHSREETLIYFNISMANHKTFCKYYNIKKR